MSLLDRKPKFKKRLKMRRRALPEAEDRFQVQLQNSRGCEFTPIQRLSRPEWMTLLDSTRESVFAELLAGEDSVHHAGARLLSALVTAQKITTAKEIEISILARHEEAVLFQAKTRTDKLYILTQRFGNAGDSGRIMSLEVPPDQAEIMLTLLETAGAGK